MSETVQKGKWVPRESDGDVFWYYESTCKKCGKPTFTALDVPRLKTGLCATCYSEEPQSICVECEPFKQKRMLGVKK